MSPLDRRLENAAHIAPINSAFRVLFDDPIEPDAPVKILIPAPSWMAAALHGGVLPPIHAYVRDAERYAAYCEKNDPTTFSWDAIGGAEHWTAPPIGPMTEEEAIQYLIIKDIPAHIRAPRNRQHIFVVRREEVSSDRTFRNAWELDEGGYIRVDMVKARRLHAERLAAAKIESDKQRERLDAITAVSRIPGLAMASTPDELKAVGI